MGGQGTQNRRRLDSSGDSSSRRTGRIETAEYDIFRKLRRTDKSGGRPRRRKKSRPCVQGRRQNQGNKNDRTRREIYSLTQTGRFFLQPSRMVDGVSE